MWLEAASTSYTLVTGVVVFATSIGSSRQDRLARRAGGCAKMPSTLLLRRARLALAPDSLLVRTCVMRLARYIPVAAAVVISTGIVAVAAPAASADLLKLPSIESESVSHVTPSDATLETEVNLHEVSTGAYYQFQIVKDPSEYGPEVACPSTRPQTFDACVGPQEPGAPPIGFLPGNSASSLARLCPPASTSPALA